VVAPKLRGPLTYTTDHDPAGDVYRMFVTAPEGLRVTIEAGRVRVSAPAGLILIPDRDGAVEVLPRPLDTPGAGS
jgi:hypothetical protein